MRSLKAAAMSQIQLPPNQTSENPQSEAKKRRSSQDKTNLFDES